jgi:hypothetical protein
MCWILCHPHADHSVSQLPAQHKSLNGLDIVIQLMKQKQKWNTHSILMSEVNTWTSGMVYFQEYISLLSKCNFQTQAVFCGYSVVTFQSDANSNNGESKYDTTKIRWLMYRMWCRVFLVGRYQRFVSICCLLLHYRRTTFTKGQSITF